MVYFMPRAWRASAVLSRTLGATPVFRTPRLVTLPLKSPAPRNVVTKGDIWGIPRAATIVVGLAATILGYAVSSARGLISRG
jgi:hypothetical protein